MKMTRSGFSMIAVIMAAGAISGLALVLANLNKQQAVIQRKVRTHFEVESVSNTILRLLFDSRACTHTVGFNSNLTENRPVTSIKNSNGTTMYNTVKKYSNNRLKIETITLKKVNIDSPASGTANLEVVFRKIGQAVKGYDKIVKKYPLALDLNPSAKLASCYSDHQFIMSTVTNSSCSQVNGFIDPLTGKCIPEALAIASQKFCEGIGATHTNPLCDLENIKLKAINSMCSGLDGSYQSTSQECTLPSPPSSP